MFCVHNQTSVSECPDLSAGFQLLGVGSSSFFRFFFLKIHVIVSGEMCLCVVVLSNSIVWCISFEPLGVKFSDEIVCNGLVCDGVFLPYCPF